MNRVLVERYIVVVLFIVVFITFSFAQRDSKKLEKIYAPISATGNKLVLQKQKKLQVQ